MKKRIYLLVSALLFLSIPWLFFEWSDINILGLPAWAVYSLLFMICFAIVVALLIERYWSDFSE